MPKRAIVISYTHQPPPIESSEQWENDSDRFCQHCGVKGDVVTFNHGETVVCLACNKHSGHPPPHDIPGRLALLKAEHGRGRP